MAESSAYQEPARGEMLAVESVAAAPPSIRHAGDWIVTPADETIKSYLLKS